MNSIDSVLDSEGLEKIGKFVEEQLKKSDEVKLHLPNELTFDYIVKTKTYLNDEGFSVYSYCESHISDVLFDDEPKHRYVITVNKKPIRGGKSDA
jgi:hypothetical protein